MFATVTAAINLLRRALASLEPRTFDGHGAARLLKLFAEAERLAAAGKALMARRVEETKLWKHDGHRSAASWLAAATGSSVGTAIGTLETARRLEDLPATAEAQRQGRLSEVQAREIASAAKADPRAEAELLGVAAREPVAALRQRCQRLKAAAAPDESARQRAVHGRRHLRHWNDPDGAFRMDLRTTADAGATILANLKPFCDQAFAEARAAGRRDSTEAYAADALVAMAESAGRPGDGAGSSGPRAMVHVRVDHGALVRGHTEAGEVCEVPGVGPIPVATARAWAGDAVLKALVTKGVDVVAVVHAGRTVTAAQRAALEERDPSCVVAGCGITKGLEIDHVDGWALTRTTTVERLARLCRWHHHLKTHCGYHLEGRAGNWRLVAPGHPPDDAGPEPTTAEQFPPTLDLGLAGPVSSREMAAPPW
ncbi:MAG: HNH endonuclease [Actinomycetota bacterium]|nr:HNH endonuclease [Actinomycetota bacterium]